MRRFMLTPLTLCLIIVSASGIPLTCSSNTTSQETQSTNPYGGTLRVGTYTFRNPYTLNPLVDWKALNPFTKNILSSLLRINETGAHAPDLAYNWSISEDGLHYTFNLYNNVTWHDGFRFNASDIKYTFDICLSEPLMPHDVLVGYGLESVEVINEFTVKFNLQNPCAPFLWICSWMPIIPWHLYNGTDIWTNPYNNSPVGTGPFSFHDWKPETGLTLGAYEGYFRGRPHLDNMTIKYDIPILDLSQLLMNNTLDIVSDAIDPNRIDELNQIPGITLASYEDRGFYFLAVNHRNPKLADLKVRQALSHSINKTRICENVYRGYATPSAGSIPPSLSYWHNPNVTHYGYNVTLAEQLLDEAGYPKHPETGVRFNLTLKGPDLPFFLETTEVIKESLVNVGINITLQNETWSQLQKDVLFNESHPFDLATFRLSWMEGAAPYDQYDLWHSGDWNAWNYSNPLVDYLLEQMRLSLNDTERREMFFELQEILAHELPVIFLHYKTCITGYNNDFHGFVQGTLQNAISPYSTEKVWYEPTLSGEGNCPYRVCFIDSEGRRTGYFNGTAYEDIPNSTYTGVDSDPQLVKIRNPSGTYIAELFGIENGSYEFEFVNIGLEYKKVRIIEGYIHESETITYVVKVYEDGTMLVTIPGDADADGFVDVSDLAILGWSWFQEPGDPRYDPRVDFNNDNFIDVSDFAILGKYWFQHI